MRAVFVLCALLIALPTASACLYVQPPLLSGLRWLSDGTLLGTSGPLQHGVVDPEAGVLTPAYPSEALWSPDARYVVFARAGPDVQTGLTRVMDDCGFYLSRHLVAYDREEDRFQLVEEGPVWGFAPAPEGVASYDGREARIRSWGSWEVVGEEPAEGIVEPLRWRGVVQADTSGLSPDGTRFAEVMEEGELRLVRTSNGEALARRSFDARLGGLAWRPEGGALAVAMPGNETRARLLMLDATTLATLEEHDIRLAEDGAWRAWHERAAREVPVPDYSWLEKVRATPSPVALVALLVGALVFRLTPLSRGTSAAPRP